MDRTWMDANRLSLEYRDGVETFLQFAIEHADDPLRIFCPCKDCGNRSKIKPNDIRDHLIMRGFESGYTKWIWHGESFPEESLDHDDVGGGDFDYMEELTNNLEGNFAQCPEKFDKLVSDSETPLYGGCIKFTRLSAVLRLYNLKASNGWSDKSFNNLLELLNDMLPEGNVLPKSTYEAKKILCSMGLNYEKIHACPNDCILYRNKYASLDSCPECQEPRYKKAKVPNKVLWYFPIIPRFKRMFSTTENAKNLIWHATDRICDDKLRHPADSLQWKTINAKFPEFGAESRNLRLALCSDGMNPFSGNTNYSLWPVLLVIYNLPPSLCMKRKWIMLSLLISGPNQPGNDIDVYLAPLVEDLKRMWDDGVEVFDAHLQERFNLRAMLFCTINDFPAYGNLSGYSVHGHYACPICEESTNFCQLKKSKKTAFLGHRRFLPTDHHYRRQKKAFNGLVEREKAPIPLTGNQVFEKVKDLNVAFGKKNKKSVPKGSWKKRSIFFDLPYWKHLLVRHCLDVMHIEKNVSDSLVGTLLNVPKKTKDGINARLDLVEMGIRAELHPQKHGNKTFLPPACYTLSKKEKIAFCECLKGIKVPEGYSSNVKNLVSLKDLKLVGMKSHDHHFLIHDLLPVAIRSILPNRVRSAITRLCFFFKELCSSVVDLVRLASLESEIVIILCQLEMYFPPSFFVIMIHLTIHLVREVRLCGPVHLHWMYSPERFMKFLKGYVRNPSRPEGCIAESYLVEEATEFCCEFLPNISTIGLPRPRHYDIPVEGKAVKGYKELNISDDNLFIQAHLYVLHNRDDVQPYVEQHMAMLRASYPSKNEKWILDNHNSSFHNWLSSKHFADDTDLYWLSHPPRREVLSYNSYMINGCTFYTKEQDDKSTMQNSGVSIVSEALHISSARDRNPVYALMTYYGVIQEIWCLDYTAFTIPLFRCNWVDNQNGVCTKEKGFTKVDLSRFGHTQDPFILAYQAKQVFYVTDPADTRWSVVLSAKKWDDDNMEGEDVLATELPFSSNVEIDQTGDVYIRDDHEEGFYVLESGLVNMESRRRKRT